MNVNYLNIGTVYRLNDLLASGKYIGNIKIPKAAAQYIFQGASDNKLYNFTEAQLASSYGEPLLSSSYQQTPSSNKQDFNATYEIWNDGELEVDGLNTLEEVKDALKDLLEDEFNSVNSDYLSVKKVQDIEFEIEKSVKVNFVGI